MNFIVHKNKATSYIRVVIIKPKKYLGVVLCLLMSFPFIVLGQALSPRTANYKMDISLDVENKMISGITELVWNNPSTNEVNDMQFHLYYNAFKNSESTFFKNGNSLGFIGKNIEEECGWSYSEILSIKDEEDHELINSSKFIAPDDGNTKDQTVLWVPLDKAVSPMGSVKLKILWKAKIPKAMIRTGYNQDYYFFAQWFPKLGVYEPAGMRYEKNGAWNCHQYHSSGEYYGEFGNYDVSLTIPDNFIVAATGYLVDEKNIENKKIYRFKAEDVIDFTWSVSPQFLKFEKKWKDVNLQLYTYPGHEIFVDRYFNSAIQSLEYLDEHVGKYPYSTLSIVDPPIHGLFTGGMEYPTLISSVSFTFFPSGVKTPETLVVHEFVHQYFMQMVSNHEQDEPWMDEGFTTYYEGRILDHYYGSKTSLIDTWGIQIGNGEFNRLEFWSKANPKIADNSYKARDFKHGGYSPIAYNKTAMMLKTLEGLLGVEKMDELMKKYFEEWKFKHPCGLDFISIFKDNLSAEFLAQKKLNLSRFFDQVLYGSFVCDYKVESIDNYSVGGSKGYLNGIDDCEIENLIKEDSSYKSVVVINRLGELILPVDVLISYEDGSQTNYIWDGEKRSTEFVSFGTNKIVKVQLDEDRKLNLEQNFINNTLNTKKSRSYRKYTSKFKVGMQHLLDFLNYLS